jgi:hypothetical protein
LRYRTIGISIVRASALPRFSGTRNVPRSTVIDCPSIVIVLRFSGPACRSVKVVDSEAD